MATNRTSPPGPSSPRPRQSREPSISSPNTAQQHRPSIPSGLRQTQLPPSSPDSHFHQPLQEDYNSHDPVHGLGVEADGLHPFTQDFASVESRLSEGEEVAGEIEDPITPPTAVTRLLESEHRYHLPHDCGRYDCNHGSFSPRPRHQRGYGSIASTFDGSATPDDDDARSTVDGFGGGTAPDADGEEGIGAFKRRRTVLADAVTDGLLGNASKRSTTAWLARRHGVPNERWLYVHHKHTRAKPSHFFSPRFTYIFTNKIGLVGTSSTTSPSQTGSDNTASPTCRATSSPL